MALKKEKERLELENRELKEQLAALERTQADSEEEKTQEGKRTKAAKAGE